MALELCNGTVNYPSALRRRRTAELAGELAAEWAEKATFAPCSFASLQKNSFSRWFKQAFFKAEQYLGVFAPVTVIRKPSLTRA